MTVITISRELGSRGTEIAEDVAAYINAICVDKEVLAEMASQAGVSVEVIAETEERLSTKPAFVSDEMRSLFASRQPVGAKSTAAMDEKEYSSAASSAIRKLAERGNVVFVGRGSQLVLADWPAALHVRLHASLEVRAARIHTRRGLADMASARRIIQRADEQRRNWFKRVFDGADLNDPHHYDLMLNTGRLNTQLVVDLIVTAAREQRYKK
ncbi:MAG: cytidylate kinase-like family protein [Caldilineaceae bacterium]|nr:cytidylate kinase-like family protein [Caldilineaceae bacterium]